jgi:hypothetical protein
MELKDQLTLVFLKAANQNCSTEEIDKFRNNFWWNFRKKDTGGLRLTDDGLKFVTDNCHLKTYSVNFPKDLKDGDFLYILSTGAYTTSYSSVCFNGFKPLKEYYI